LKLWKSLEISDKNEIVTQPSRPSRPPESISEPPVPLKEGTEVKRPKRKFVLKRKIRKPLKEPHLKETKSTESVSSSSILSTDDTGHPPKQTSLKKENGETSRSDNSRPKERCARCLELPSSLVRCGFCREIFCKDSLDECYENHECPGSMVCSKCGRRVQNEIVEIADHCHQYFCSPKCMNECWMKNFMKTGCFGCTVGSKNEKEEKEVDAEMEERDGFEEEAYHEEESEEEEMCGGLPKRIACRRCQKESCQGRFCDGYCNKCRFDSCEIRCEYDGECKFCSEFDDCVIRCKEAPDGCDKRRCRGFRCEERWVSGDDCDEDCGNCSDEGCYFWNHSPDQDEVDEE
jgi:hypothetical protein